MRNSLFLDQTWVLTHTFIHSIWVYYKPFIIYPPTVRHWHAVPVRCATCMAKEEAELVWENKMSSDSMHCMCRRKWWCENHENCESSSGVAFVSWSILHHQFPQQTWQKKSELKIVSHNCPLLIACVVRPLAAHCPQMQHNSFSGTCKNKEKCQK